MFLMNKIIENNKGNWFECVNYGEDRVGCGSGGLGSIMGNSEIIIDKNFGKNNKEIFQVDLKQMHNKNNCLSNWSSTKNIGSHGKSKQVNEPFKNWMTIMLMLIPFNLQKWNALCVITCSKKKKVIIIHKVGKVWLSLTRTMAQLPWVIMFLLSTLQFWF